MDSLRSTVTGNPILSLTMGYAPKNLHENATPLSLRGANVVVMGCTARLRAVKA